MRVHVHSHVSDSAFVNCFCSVTGWCCSSLFFLNVNIMAITPVSPGNWLKRSSLSGLTDGVEDLLDISSVDRLSFIRQSSKVSAEVINTS